MCDNTAITAVPENVFLLEKDINRFIDCDNHDKIKQIDVAELLKFEQTPWNIELQKRSMMSVYDF